MQLDRMIAERAQAATISYTPDDLRVYAYQKAEEQQIDADQFVGTLQCESKFHYAAVGDGGTSYGVAQIHLPAHTDISKEQALDPYFSIDWSAGQFSIGNERIWSCYRMLYGSVLNSG